MKIIFKEVKIADFLSIGDATVKLDYSGVTLITGVNNNDALSVSNGAGKSSIIEAILWCLTGVTSRGVSDVSNNATEHAAAVTLVFSIDEFVYEVTRKADPSALILRRNGEDISGNTYTKSKKILSEVLGVANYELISSIVILSQGLQGRLSSLKPAERKTRLEYFSNLQNLMDSVTDKVGDVLKDITVSFTSKQNELNQVLRDININRESINQYRQKIEELSNSQCSMSEDDVSAIRQKNIEASKKVSELDEKISQGFLENQRRENQIRQLKNNLDRYRQELVVTKKNYTMAIKGVCPTCQQPYFSSDLIESYNTQLSNIMETAKLEKAQLGELESRESIDISILKQEKMNLMDEISYNNRLLSDWEKNSVSSEVWQGLIDKSMAVLEDIEPRIPGLKAEVSSLEKDMTIAKWYKQAIPRKFRNFLLDGVVDYLNKRLAIYSSYLFSDRQVSLENNGNDLLIKLGNLSFESLSGGEGRRVDLIIQLGLRDLAINQSGFYCNLLVMDEVFDYLDESGILSFLRMIDQESCFSDSMMVITHRNEIKISSSRSLVVTKNQAGISSVREFLMGDN